MPITLNNRFVALEPRTDQSQPAFTACSLDDRPGSGNPADGDPKGQVNLYLFWETGNVVDQPDSWEMTVGLVDKAPKDRCTVSITPRRLQKLKPERGEKFRWTSTPVGSDKAIQSGEVAADDFRLLDHPASHGDQGEEPDRDPQGLTGTTWPLWLRRERRPRRVGRVLRVPPGTRHIKESRMVGLVSLGPPYSDGTEAVYVYFACSMPLRAATRIDRGSSGLLRSR